MAISINRYIDVTSSVGGASVLNTRELIGRFFTINPLLPTNSILEFTSPDDVLTYFGSTSVEYLRASSPTYFGFIGKNGTSPQKVSFARWTNVDQAPMIFGGSGIATLTAFQLVTTGAFSMTLGGVTNVISGLDFSAATSLADVAEIIEDAIQAETGAQWTGATVTYDASGTGSFNFVGGSAVVANVIVAIPGTGTDITAMIRWLEAVGPTGAIWSDGELAESITEILTNSTATSDNFGSFLFMPTFDEAQILEATTWNDAQNNEFQYSAAVTASNATAVSGVTITLSGTALVLSPLNTEYPEQLNMAILAATDYTAQNSTVNYMYQMAGGLTPSVSDDSVANTYDALRVNYYGVTQSAGQLVAFYQRGFLTGNPSIDAVDMNTYANEQWLRSRATSALMNLLLASPKISANNNGKLQVITMLQSTVIAEGLTNGTISVGKQLTPLQQAFITGVTGDPKAWTQVQNLGYWLGVSIVSFIGLEGLTEFKIVYTLVYSKDDVVRSIVGRDILI